MLDVTGGTTLTLGTITGSGRSTPAGRWRRATRQSTSTAGPSSTRSGPARWSAGPLCLQTGGMLRVTGSLAVAAGNHGFNCQDATAQFDIEPTGT